MARHLHADIIHAWAEGAEIEYWFEGDKEWYKTSSPSFDPDTKYRIKPKELEWWENIPEHGVLVKNKISDYVYSVTCIDDLVNPQLYTPLTNEEIERFKR